MISSRSLPVAMSNDSILIVAMWPVATNNDFISTVAMLPVAMSNDCLSTVAMRRFVAMLLVCTLTTMAPNVINQFITAEFLFMTGCM